MSKLPTNIVEGYGRETTADYIRFLYIAYGLTCELKTQIMLSGDLGYMDTKLVKSIIGKTNEVERILNL